MVGSGRFRAMIGGTVAVVVGGAVGVAVGLIALAFAFQNRMIYFPGDDVPPPADVGLPGAETVTVTTAGGLDLRSWVVPAEGEPVGAVLVLHGNAGTRAARAPLATALARRGLTTMLLDYRGYGGNPGRPSQDGLLADARAGLDALRGHSGFSLDRIVLFGESLGSGVAAGLAAERPVGGLVLRSPFPSLVEVGRIHYPLLPVGLLLRDRYPVSAWLAEYDGPTVVVVGQRDDLIPPDLSLQVTDAAAGPVRTITVDGAGHNSRALLDGDELLAGLTQFLRDDVGLPVRTPPS